MWRAGAALAESLYWSPACGKKSFLRHSQPCRNLVMHSWACSTSCSATLVMCSGMLGIPSTDNPAKDAGLTILNLC